MNYEKPFLQIISLKTEDILILSSIFADGGEEGTDSDFNVPPESGE